jgi:hypothetical protein
MSGHARLQLYPVFATFPITGWPDIQNMFTQYIWFDPLP